MGLYRLYTGDDGQSHFETLDLESHPELASPTDVTTITFNHWPVGRFVDWHPAPRRQYVISLSGTLEIGLGDGSTSQYSAGDARLVEDTSGQGHTTRVVGDQPCLTATVPLKNQ